jgi:hypothetical protein
MKNKLKIISNQLSVDYVSPDGNTINLEVNPLSSDKGFELSVYDVTPDSYTGKTTMGFNRIGDLEAIIEDFKEKCNKLYDSKQI